MTYLLEVMLNKCTLRLSSEPFTIFTVSAPRHLNRRHVRSRPVGISQSVVVLTDNWYNRKFRSVVVRSFPDLTDATRAPLVYPLGIVAIA